jgi:hypothetical protein
MNVLRAFFKVREHGNCVARFPEKGIIDFQKQGAVALDYERVKRVHDKRLKITYAGRGEAEFVRSLTTDSTTSNLEGCLTVCFTAFC